MKVTRDFNEYEPWSGAVKTYDAIVEADKLEELETFLEDAYGDTIGEVELNDILWFDGDDILKHLGITEEEEE